MKILNHLDTLCNYKTNPSLVSPITVELDLTNKCNHRCKQCSTTLLYKTIGEKIKFDEYFTIQTAKKLILELEEMKVKSLIFTGGGEPLIFPGFIEILEYALPKLDIGIKTNGSVIKEQDISSLLKAKWIRISLDNANKESFLLTHGIDDFENVCNNIKRICSRKRKCTIGIGFLIGKNSSIEEIEQGVMLVKMLGVDYIQLRPFSNWKDTGSYDSAISKLQKKVNTDKFTLKFPNKSRFGKKHSYKKCHMVHMCPKIAANGNVYACCSRRDNEVLLGNLKEKNFKEIWTMRNIDNIDLSKCLDICRHHQTNEDINALFENKTDSHWMFI